ncbi:MAG: sigma-70 family RNA polymerase sigma factor [Armatimonadetes bacterium]|nr:sigma-70 family RNA polymerase sigma factor [Armatimonadota bacterium]
MDSHRFEALVRKHKDSVYRQMVRVCSHREDAEDALATSLMLAFRASPQLESEEAFRSWLSTIGKRVCTRMRSHPRMREVLAYAEEHDLVDTQAEAFDVAILKGCVKEAIEHLRPIYRSIYEMCDIDELSVPDAARQLGISEAAAKSRLLRARAEVRSLLDGSVCGR